TPSPLISLPHHRTSFSNRLDFFGLILNPKKSSNSNKRSSLERYVSASFANSNKSSIQTSKWLCNSSSRHF
ncbi:hypothetical protein PHMEG_00035634, partial [Phytophthora megakarya]